MKKTILVLLFASSSAFAIGVGGHASGGHSSGHASAGHATAHATAPHPTATPHVVAPIESTHTPPAKTATVISKPVSPKEETGTSSGYPYYNKPVIVPGAVHSTCDKSKDKDCK